MIDSFLSLGNWPLTIVSFLVAIGIVVFVHELGHYLAARAVGIEVLVFSVGFGPAIVKARDRLGTIWQIGIFPVGGYVRFADSTKDGQPKKSVARGTQLSDANLFSRALTVSAGPLANFVTSTAIFVAIILSTGIAKDEVTIGSIEYLPSSQYELKEGDTIFSINEEKINTIEDFFVVGSKILPIKDVVYGIYRNGTTMEVPGPHPFPPIINSVRPGSSAADAGLRRGDVILNLNGEPIRTFSELAAAAPLSITNPMQLEVWRQGTIIDVEIQGRLQDLPVEGGGFEQKVLIGITGGAFFKPETYTPGIISALEIGIYQTGEIIQGSVVGLYAVVRGAISKCNIQGPIGIARISSDAAEQGTLSFISLIAVLSTAIGFVNLLPIPGLDGGYLAFNLYEVIFRKKPSQEFMNVLMTFGFFIIILILMFGIFNDLTC